MDQTAPQIVTQVQPPGLDLTLTRNSWYTPCSFQTASWMIKHLPRPLTRSMAVAAGELGYRLCKHRREALRRNLTALTQNEKHRRALSRKCFHNFLRMLHDFCDCAQSGANRLNALIVERRGFEFLEAARRKAKGILLITGHLGAWELGGMVLASDGFPVNVVTLAEPTNELNEWRQKYRQHFGIKTVTVGVDKFAFVEIIQALRRNELVAMLVDRPYLNSGVEVEFFGRTTLFSAAAARVWQHTQAAVIPAFVLQLEPGQYGCYAYPPIEMTPDHTLEQNSQCIADVFQEIIREFPEQWFNFVPIWNHQSL
ncbi:MAG: lysophospholipid acyltransferase family protein [Verrucomicrobia bacterium]|nr:lysophospholipid acyltransferase family protein [Verrucomicrobiota bacterium]